MFKGKSVEIIKCTHCGEEIGESSCADCNTWFEDGETIFCDERRSHYCKKCGEPKYRQYKIIKENSTLDEFS